MAKPIIEGLKLIEHNMGGVKIPDDPAYGPWRLDAVFRVPGFMDVAATFIYGREQIVVRGKTKEALEQFVEMNQLKTHPRLQTLEITQPESNDAKQTSTGTKDVLAVAEKRDDAHRGSNRSLPDRLGRTSNTYPKAGG